MTVAKLGNLTGSGAQELAGGFSRLTGQNQQKLPAPARTQEHPGEAHLGKQGAGQHFRNECQPLRAARKQFLAGKAARSAGRQERLNTQNFPL